jgi:hypothetical protein
MMSESEKNGLGCLPVIVILIILAAIESTVFSILDFLLAPVHLIANLVGEDLFLLVWIPIVIVGILIYEHLRS